MGKEGNNFTERRGGKGGEARKDARTVKSGIKEEATRNQKKNLDIQIFLVKQSLSNTQSLRAGGGAV